MNEEWNLRLEWFSIKRSWLELRWRKFKVKFPFTPCHQCVAEVGRVVRVGPTVPYHIHSIYLSLLSCLSVCLSVYREYTIRSKGVSSTLFIHFCNSLFREGWSKSIEFTFHLTPTTPSLFSFLFTTTSFALFIFVVVLFFSPTSSFSVTF